MSTNFYWLAETAHGVVVTDMDPKIHLGKRSGRGGGLMVFNWAHDPKLAIEICERFPNRHIVIDEYGQRYSGAEFVYMLKEMEQTTDSVGTHFC